MSDATYPSTALPSLPEGARCVTNAVLTSGNQIHQGWRLGDRYFETWRYAGALNYAQISELHYTPEWSAKKATTNEES